MVSLQLGTSKPNVYIKLQVRHVSRVRITLRNTFRVLVIAKVRECGRQQSKVKMLLLQRCALHKFRLTDDQNTRD